ncbi:MAG: response regulator [Candidatus Latescibacteria bacterium]|jgi:two-component system chemotaxis response regulator CheY|nr:response regulator [Candidatus Latescibacterota bacterium]
MSYNFLVIDDSKTARLMLAKSINLSGLPIGEVHMAENGREALDLLRNNWIDMVLTDINMPDMNGMELVRIMAQEGLLQTVPVVVVSTEGSDIRIGELRDQGIRDYLRKPVRAEHIRDVVEQILGNGE